MPVPECKPQSLVPRAFSDYRQGIGKARAVAHPGLVVCDGRQLGEPLGEMLDQQLGAPAGRRKVKPTELHRAGCAHTVTHRGAKDLTVGQDDGDGEKVREGKGSAERLVSGGSGNNKKK